MQLKIYTSFYEINKELEILKLEKELNYHKLALSFDKTKENLQPQSIKRELIFYAKETITETFRSFLVLGIPYVLNYLKRKRG